MIVREFHDAVLHEVSRTTATHDLSLSGAQVVKHLVAETLQQAEMAWEAKGGLDDDKYALFASLFTITEDAALTNCLSAYFTTALRKVAISARDHSIDSPASRAAATISRARQWLKQHAELLAARTQVNVKEEQDSGEYTACFMAAADAIVLRSLAQSGAGVRTHLSERELQRMASDDFCTVRKVCIGMFLQGHGAAPTSRPLLRVTDLELDEVIVVEMAALSRATGPWSKIRNPLTGRVTSGLALRAPTAVYFLGKLGNNQHHIVGDRMDISRETG